MSSNKTISVIVPAYNVEKYFKQALNSLGEQRFNDYEIIIVNDGSSDDTLKIALEFQKNNNNIIIINQDNAGQAHARNVGIEHSTGEYIYFFDSDDVLGNDALKIMYDAVNNKDIDILLFSGDAFSDDKAVDLNNFYYKKTINKHKILTGQEMFLQLIQGNEYTPSPCLYLIKKKLLTQYNIRFFEGVIHEDILFSWKIMMLSCQSMVIPNTLFHRRVRQNSTMTSNNLDYRVRSLIKIFKEIYIISNTNEVFNNYDINFKILSDIYGNIIRLYSKISRKERKVLLNDVNDIQNIAEQYKNFDRWDFKLFAFSKFMYAYFRNIFDAFIRK